jgi:hypothetical protein
MLKLLAPLKIKAKTTYIRDAEAFYYRIIGGYSLMSLHIDEEDLLHITSTPPEIYVAEGGEMTGIYTNSRHNEVNINKVNILNNVLNRIFLSADIELTYQDRVFITDMLYKLGIKDDRKFMKAFYRIAQETENTNALINAYFEKGSIFIEKVKELELIRKEFSQKSHSTQETQKDNYLYNSVMKRLMTGNIYRIVSNFNRSVQSNEIDAREFALSDQTYTSGNILLNMLREQSREASDELVFINNNTYEDETISDINESNTVKNIVNSAVLMDILKTIYHAAYDKFHENSDTFYRFENTFYRASEQTILKLVSKVENNFFKSFETEKLIERASKLSESELELLVKEISPGATDEEIQRIAENITIYNLLNEKRRLLSEKINQQDITESEIFEPETDQIPLATGENEDENESRENTTVITDEEIKRITESINQLNLQNEKRRLLYEKELQKIQEKQKIEVGRNEIERTRKDAAIALENPEKLEEILKISREKYIQKQNNLLKEIRQLVPLEYRNVLTILNKIDEGDKSFIQNNVVRNADVGELMQDIRIFSSPQTEETEHKGKREPKTDVYTEFLNQKANEKVVEKTRNQKIAPVETVHKSNISLSREEINEQLDIIQKYLSRQINKATEQAAATENHTVKTTEIKNYDTQVNKLSSRDIERLIENGVQSRMASLSNSVMNKIEKQMKNEKMRRGY